jgi:hypothetical protein
MPPTMHKRCHYVSPETGIECEIWHTNESDFCILHGSSAVAPNGTAKDPYIAKRNEAMTSIAEAVKGLSVPEALAYLDSHLAGIEQVIADQKIKALAARGKKAEIIDGLSDAERTARQKIRTPKFQTDEKKRDNAAKELGASMKKREMAIASTMKAYGKTREQAIALLDS